MRGIDRQELRARYEYRCGYCGISEVDAGAELTVDHFVPRAHGGTDHPENLVYCCHACNKFKGDYWAATIERSLLHPGMDTLADHVTVQGDGTLQPRSERGAFHIARLRLNRAALAAHRVLQVRLEASHRAEPDILSRIAQLEDHVRSMQATIAAALKVPPDEEFG